MLRSGCTAHLAEQRCTVLAHLPPHGQEHLPEEGDHQGRQVSHCALAPLWPSLQTCPHHSVPHSDRSDLENAQLIFSTEMSEMNIKQVRVCFCWVTCLLFRCRMAPSGVFPCQKMAQGWLPGGSECGGNRATDAPPMLGRVQPALRVRAGRGGPGRAEGSARGAGRAEGRGRWVANRRGRRRL